MLTAGLAACGPIAYVNEVTRKASDSVEQARVEQADKYSPYYWTRATQYLHQSRVLAAHADFVRQHRLRALRRQPLGDEAARVAGGAEDDDARAHGGGRTQGSYSGCNDYRSVK